MLTRSKPPRSDVDDIGSGVAASEASLVANDPQMAEIVQLTRRLSGASSNVVVCGESGTGKDLLAHALHFWGERKSQPLAKVDLASIPSNLIESELFGYVRGAFTSANATKAGRFELAGGGTLFLDHIGELSPLLQAKLLRVVEDRRFERLGDTESISLDARIVASAGADLDQSVARGLFRRDLFHRLSVFQIRLPPLRERVADIAPLAELFLSRELGRHPGGPGSLDGDVADIFDSYGWPGNVRELKSAVEHAFLIARGEVISRSDIPGHLLDVGAAAGKGARPSLAEVEKRYIARILKDVGGNQTRAAEILGISRKSLWQRRRKYGLE